MLIQKLKAMGACYTEFDDAVDEGNLVALLRAGRYRGVDTRKISRWRASEISPVRK